MRINVASWWYKKEQTKAQGYNWTLCWEHVYKRVDENGELVGELLTEAQGKWLYEAGKADEVGFALFGDKLKETDKAIQMELSFWNLRKAGRYVTDAPVEKRWKTWVPKSVLL